MRAVILGAALLMAAASLPALAEKPESHPTYKGVTAEEGLGIVFTEIEKRLIREYFGKQAGVGGNGKGKNKSKEMPHGLAKRDELPPGLQQHVEKHGTLPPGLAKRDLPSDLTLKLPSLKKGLERKIVGSDVVLIQTATGIVLDVIQDVVKGQ